MRPFIFGYHIFVVTWEIRPTIFLFLFQVFIQIIPPLLEFVKKVESKVWRQNYWTFLPTRESRSVDLASIDSREENSSRNRKRLISRRRKRWSTRSSLKEIVNFVFYKSPQETWTQLSRLILHKKEIPRKEQTLKIGFKKNFDIRYQRNVFSH